MAKISLDMDSLKNERADLSNFLAQPDAYSSPDFTVKNKRFSELETLISKGEERENLEKNLVEAKELANEVASWLPWQNLRLLKPKLD